MSQPLPKALARPGRLVNGGRYIAVLMCDASLWRGDHRCWTLMLPASRNGSQPNPTSRPLPLWTDFTNAHQAAPTSQMRTRQL